MNIRPPRSFAVLLVAASTLPASWLLAGPVGRVLATGTAESPESRLAAPVDRWGRPVVNASGQQVVYEQRDLPAEPPGGTAAASTAAAASSETPSGSISYRLRWQFSVFGEAIGKAGLEVVDLAGNGEARIVASASGSGNPYENDFWYVLAPEAAGGAGVGGYSHLWVSDPYAEPIHSLRTANLDADPANEVLVGTGSRILVYDGATFALERTIATAAAEIRGLTVADVDSDGQLEVVFCDGTALYVYDATTGALETRGEGFGGADLAVGNVDDDSSLEIVVGNGNATGYVLDGQTLAVEWANSWGFGQHVRLGDLDADGRQEVVAGYAWQVIRVFDADLQSLAASISVEFDLGALRVLDVEGDGPLEIVYGDGQWGSIHVLNGQDRSQKWALANPEHGITDIALGDTDGDDVLEVVWGAGYSSSGPEHLYVASTVTRETEWQSLDLGGPFYALAVGRPSGSLVVLSGSFESDSGFGDGPFFYHDAETGRVLYQSPPPTGQNRTRLRRIRAANVDQDQQDEVFVATGYVYRGRIVCFDGTTHAQQWNAEIADGLTVASMELADVDHDGSLEVVAGVEAQFSGAPGVLVYVLDAATGAEEWRSPSLTDSSSLPFLRLANVDADPQPEIIVGSTNSALFLLDAVHRTTQHLGFHDVTALDAPDRNSDGRAEIVIGTNTGAVQVVDPVSGSVVETVVTVPPRIDGLAVDDLDQDGVFDYVLAVGNTVQVRDGATLGLSWSSGVIGLGTADDAVGALDSLTVASLDASGFKDILVNSGRSGFRVFRRLHPVRPRLSRP